MGNKYQQVNNKKICDISYGKKKKFESEGNEQSANFFGSSDPFGNHLIVG